MSSGIFVGRRAGALMLAAMLALPFTGAAAVAQPLRILAAGSLGAPLKDVIAASGVAAEAVFGPSGSLRQRLENGETADLFLSADLAHPRLLAAAGRAAPVVAFARNKLCTLSRASLGLTDENLAARLIDPAVRLATSTPGADPGGDYAWQVFARAEAVRSGARKILEDKALQLVGGPNSPAPLPGRTAAASIFAADKADILLSYCSGHAEVMRDVPGLVSRRLPAALDVTAVYGLAALSQRPETQRFALFLLSEAGQSILARHGLLPVVETDPAAGRAGEPASAHAEPGLLLQRKDGAPVAITLDRLAAFAQTTQRVTQRTGRGEETTEWSGPLLWDVLTTLGVIDPARHGDHPRMTLRAIGKDGYTVALAIAELSPEFAGKPVIIANRLNGVALPNQALRLVVPGDRRAGRSVRDLVRISVD
ncbi:MAG: extracellular solute-binding protein [Rhizobiales bacterium]|nr:extracellular solute-binding protein [Hyphomicrobiales bacterium]